MKRFLTITCFLLLAFVFACPSHSADTAKAAAFYKGKNIGFTINKAAGGDADILALFGFAYLRARGRPLTSSAVFAACFTVAIYLIFAVAFKANLYPGLVFKGWP